MEGDGRSELWSTMGRLLPHVYEGLIACMTGWLTGVAKLPIELMGGVFTGLISMLLKDLRGEKENASIRSRNAIHSTKTKPYIKRIQYNIKH